MSETEKYGNNAHKKAFGRGKSEQNAKKTILTCVHKHAPIASQARHFPPRSGEAND